MLLGHDGIGSDALGGLMTTAVAAVSNVFYSKTKVPCSPKRGSTIEWQTIFYDAYGNIVQPNGATLSIAYPNGTIEIAMSPGPSPIWVAQWDSRGATPGQVAWSIHSNSPVPSSVEDGAFVLSANAANLTTF
jgi:hypothetical protein